MTDAYCLGLVENIDGWEAGEYFFEHCINPVDASKNVLLEKINTLENLDFAGGGELFDNKNIYNEIYIKNLILILIILGFSIIGIYNYKQKIKL
jgi:hypothetical protein